MMLTVPQAYELLAKHGSYIPEVCDKCGAGIACWQAGPSESVVCKESGQVWRRIQRGKI